jgi:hypothetical protein
MIDEKVVEVVRAAFAADGIWSDVDQSESMFLLVPHTFAHVVLKDASKYEVAMDAMRRIQVQLKSEGETFDWRLRSRWKIERVECLGPHCNENGAICAASEMRVEMRSGIRIVYLRIPFTHQAGEDLRTATGAARDDYGAHKRAQIEKTRKYIEFLVDAGGEMAWDPLWRGADQLTINSDTLAWILQEERRLAVS